MKKAVPPDIDGFFETIRQIEYLIREYVEHYHTERSREAKETLPLVGDWAELPRAPIEAAKIVWRPRLGGLLRSYHRGGRVAA